MGTHWLAAATLAALVSGNVSAADGLVQIDAETLQYDFVKAKDLVVEPDWHDLPPDAARLLDHVSRNFVGGKSGLANIGEEWSTSDFVMLHLPMFQHLFSAYSDKVMASVFIAGGNGTVTYTLLAHRYSEEFCIFRTPELGMASLRITTIQDLVRPNRHPSSGPLLECQPQSVQHALQLKYPSG